MTDFRTGCKNDAFKITFFLLQNVSTLSNSVAASLDGSEFVQRNNFLTTKDQRRWSIEALHRANVSSGDFLLIAGTNHIEVWNNPQTTHSFHRLVSRSIFSHSNRVVSQDVGHRKLRKPGDPDRRTKVVCKDAEGRSAYTEEAVVSNTVTDSAHSVLANAKPDIAARWITSSKIPLFFEIILSRPKEIGRTSDHRRHRLCNSINNNSTRSTGCISIVITKGWNLIREVSWDYFGHAVLKLA